MPITSFEQGRAELAEQDYAEEASPINQAIRELNARLKVYESGNWETLEPILVYWKEHFRDSLVQAKTDEERHLRQGACLAIEEVLGGKRAITDELNELATQRDKLRERFGMGP